MAVRDCISFKLASEAQVISYRPLQLLLKTVVLPNIPAWKRNRLGAQNE